MTVYFRQKFGKYKNFGNVYMHLRIPRHLVINSGTLLYHSRKTLFVRGDYPYHQYNWLSFSPTFMTEHSNEFFHDYIIYSYQLTTNITLLSFVDSNELNYYLWNLDANYRHVNDDYGAASYICNNLLLPGVNVGDYVILCRDIVRG